MRPTFTAAACVALVGLLTLAQSASAEPKTARQCNSDWAANKTAIQASGKTKRAFVAECRGITVAARQSPALDKGQYTSEAEAKAKVGLITHSPGNIPLDACDFEAPRGAKLPRWPRTKREPAPKK